jgi:hypothetical protein
MMSNTILGICLGISLGIISAVSNLEPVEYDRSHSIVSRYAYYTELLIRMGTPYVWGGKDPDEVMTWGIDKGKKGVDCSGAEFYKWHKAGASFPRTTSRKMWLGVWPGQNIEKKDGALEYAHFPHQIYFTYKPSRPQGHVGVVMYPMEEANKLVFAEASWGKKKYKETMMFTNKGYYFNHLAGIKVLDLTPGRK